MFVLGNVSKDHMRGLHPALINVGKGAIVITKQDYGIIEGVRTRARQVENVAKGVSWTMDSKHLVQPDGFGHALDAVPWHQGAYRWEWALVFPVAAAFRAAAIAENVRLRWGGVWDRVLNDLPATPEGLKAAVEAYCIRHPGVDRIDGPHYEMVT